ncbi:MAG: hemerythrin domain-containing protein [Nitrososphaeraceae archaeon]|nr:hemerythrin domain-containing protein [Nitrososphaeraceae archaeon]
MNATQNLKNDHITIRRVKEIAQKCSNRLYANQYIPIEDVEIISVIIEEFVDHFHHGKEEKAYFPDTKDKNGFAEDVRKFLIEHELGRRIAIMLRRELNALKQKRKGQSEHETNKEDTINMEPVARFLKSYAVFIDDHTSKEDRFFDMVDKRNVITTKEDEMLLKHYEMCKNQAGGEARMQEMVTLIEYLEERKWMKN